MVEYKYDAWGKPIARRSLTIAYETLGKLNPFRYRGYVYDEETELYYLRSRYYNPTWERFVNADPLIGTIGKINGHNQYTYCRNAPVSMVDPCGNHPNIFYFYGKDQAKHAESNIRGLDDDFEVEGYLITCPQDFTDAWSNMYSIVGEDNIDIVVVNMHGSPYSVDNIDLSTLDFTKNIDTFVLLSCYAGHQSTGYENFAQKILNTSNCLSLIHI